MRHALVTLALLLAACAPSTPTPVRTETFSGTTAATEKQRADAPVAVLREVRAARQEGFDRVVFELDGMPGYRIGYQDRPVQCGSGEPVEVAGTAWLQVQLLPAQAHTEAGEPTVRERERRLDLPVVKEIESTCDFEADVTWVLGLAARRPYRVQELASPPRLVVDVGHAD